jgi:hypothetical protein
MLHVRVTAPGPVADRVVELARLEPTVANLVRLPGQVRAGSTEVDGALVLFDVARESASDVLERVRGLGVEERGSIAATDTDLLFSADARRAERAAPGDPEDAVVWAEIESTARSDAGLTWAFLLFLVLAALIAGIGRYLDQPILIVGAMVVGPEFAPVSATCIGIARRMPDVVRRAVTTLLAGAAGVLSLTSRKSSALVGVFISVTTVPAAGTLALAIATGLWPQAGRSLIQLGVNLAGMIVAGTLTLLVRALLWRHVRPRRAGARGVQQ